MKGEVRVGISGWRYPPWRGVFYPPKLTHRRELEYASRRVRTIEINGSFYSLQRPSSYRRWYEETPDDFVFAVKGGRFITHAKKLVDCETPLANFFGSGVLALEDKLGPILWQLPPQLRFDADRLTRFFAILPRTTLEAARLARKHDHRVVEAFVGPKTNRPIRHAIEIRHESYRDPRFTRLLETSRIGLCVADTAGKWPALDDVTSDFVYARLHGDKALYVSGYSPRSLDAWVARIEAWRDRARDVYVYFDNDVKVRAPYDAMNLAARLGQGERVSFPRAAHREAEDRRGVEEPRPIATDSRWNLRSKSA